MQQQQQQQQQQQLKLYLHKLDAKFSHYKNMLYLQAIKSCLK